MVFEKLQKLKPREQLGLALAGVFLVFLLVDRFAVQPVMETLGWFEQQIEAQRKEVAYRRSVALQEPLVNEAYQQASDRIETVTTPAEVIDGMRASIDKLARETGLMIGSMAEREPQSSEFHQTFAVEIGSFDSTLPELLEFLYKIDAQPGMLRVARLTLDTDSPRKRVGGSILVTKVAVRRNAG